MIYDDYLTPAEIMLIELLKNKTNSEKDEILGELEKRLKQ